MQAHLSSTKILLCTFFQKPKVLDTHPTPKAPRKKSHARLINEMFANSSLFFTNKNTTKTHPLLRSVRPPGCRGETCILAKCPFFDFFGSTNFAFITILMTLHWAPNYVFSLYTSQREIVSSDACILDETNLPLERLESVQWL